MAEDLGCRSLAFLVDPSLTGQQVCHVIAPVRRFAHVATDPVHGDSPVVEGQAPWPAGRPGSASAEILICNRAMATMAELRQVLPDACYVVHQVGSARRMMQRMARHHPDLILCDADLPGRTTI